MCRGVWDFEQFKCQPRRWFLNYLTLPAVTIFLSKVLALSDLEIVLESLRGMLAFPKSRFRWLTISWKGKGIICSMCVYMCVCACLYIHIVFGEWSDCHLKTITKLFLRQQDNSFGNTYMVISQLSQYYCGNQCKWNCLVLR